MITEKWFSNYKTIPKLQSKKEIFKLNIYELKPTQFCVGYSEVLTRKNEFSCMSIKERLYFLRSRPTPIVIDNDDNLWMLDRHHRLRAFMEIDPKA